jgi:Arginyl-tRNA synthetase
LAIYLTQDLAATFLKQKDFAPDEQIWVVADEQNYHFQVLFATLEKLQILSVKNLFHLNYGLVNLPDGRMKSREGRVVDADNLMDDLHEIAAEKIRENFKNEKNFFNKK